MFNALGETSLILYLLILLVACLYSSVGHGGASGYLALMSFFTIPIASMKPVALILNIVVSIIAFVQFYRSGFFDKKIFLLLAVTSVPFAYAGGLIVLDAVYYKQLLGVFLFFAAARLAIPTEKEVLVSETPHTAWLLLIGAGIGFLSGMLGIGGGIILSPILILLGYADIRKTAGISALFIFVNSIAGLLGYVQQGIHFTASMAAMVILAMVGGLIGSFYGAKKFNIPVMKRVLAVVLILAAMKLVFV